MEQHQETAVRPAQRRYHSEQIIASGRWAWSSSDGSQQADFYYDGSRFWHLESGTRRTFVPNDAAPRDGWWHAGDCVCALCRPSAR
jgi:hypothetical protein